ncbi:RHS repeat-associated core domain-containing protein [Dyella subtropica]|uniref:RHS repeat-associated core domain-containing protein n=1 Tax=Dyella subtropica TaxID=2992127 RepID=UPI00224D404B|nr:RHS repeat-associated core domain-containing protein [Dyella subtropica]
MIQWVYSSMGQTLARCEIDPALASSYTCAPTGVVPAGVRRWTYTYCTAVDSTQCPIIGLLLSVTGPRTDLTQTATYSYYLSSSAVSCGTPGAACYQAGDLHTVTDALGHVTTIASYDGAGRITRLTDTNCVNTDLTYTPRGWLASRSVGGAIMRFTYTPYGAVASITDPDNVTVSTTYDAAHRLTRVTDALGNYIQYTLDAAGNKTAEQVYDSSGTLRKSLSRTYNTLGQLTGLTDGLSHTVFNASFTDSYDANGNLVHTADALGIQRKQGYDGLNRLVSTLDNYSGTDSATQNTQSVFAYDARDQLLGVGDPDGLNTTYDYDGLSNPKAVHSPDTGTTAYVVDAVGNRTQQTDAKGNVSTSSYDALNRRLATTYTDPTLNVSYTYDEANSVTGCSSSSPVGRLTRVIENAVTTVFCYDARGNVIQKRQAQATQTDVTQYSYTLGDRLGSVIAPSTTATQYTRDGAGRITTVTVTPPGTSAGTAVSGITYLPFGPIASYTLGNGQTVTRSYDANYVLTDVTSPALNLHFARDAMGNPTALGSAPGANPATESYGYDPLYRLTGVNNASGAAIEAYTYSKTGDRLSKTASGLATGTYGYQSGTHWLTSIGTSARSYDANGNTTGSAAGGDTWGYGYNGRNRMTVVQRNGQTVASYSYNALGQRIAKSVTFPQAVSQRFAYDESSQLIGEYGSASRDYIWLDNVPVAVVDTTGTTSTVSYVHADGLNTPRAITDATGAVIWQWAYQGNPFGEQQPTSSNGYTFNLRFPGQYYDLESGQYYNQQRDYDPFTGRYRQSDPIGQRGGRNTYAYVDSDPLGGVDPLGLRKVILFGPNDSILLQRAKEYKDDPGKCLVYSHGNPSFIYDSRDGTTKKLGDAKEIVDLLKSEGCTGDMPVVLYSCRTGMGDNTIAEDISKTKAFPSVTAPTSYTWYNQAPASNGPTQIFGKKFDGSGKAEMDTSDPGTMRTFP